MDEMSKGKEPKRTYDNEWTAGAKKDTKRDRNQATHQQIRAYAMNGMDNRWTEHRRTVTKYNESKDWPTRRIQTHAWTHQSMNVWHALWIIMGCPGYVINRRISKIIKDSCRIHRLCLQSASGLVKCQCSVTKLHSCFRPRNIYTPLVSFSAEHRSLKLSYFVGILHYWPPYPLVK